VGDGPEAAALQLERDRRGLSAVEFRPAVPVERVGDVLEECHALLVPLRAHPVLADFIPSKLYDGMAAGRPVIVAAAGEAARLVEETGCGLVTEPEDGEGLAAAVRALAGDRERAGALGAAGRAAAPDHVRSRQIERVEAVLAQVAGAGRTEAA
jgi:glycosyltransferase involved in cell wall biosynthesis